MDKKIITTLLVIVLVLIIGAVYWANRPAPVGVVPDDPPVSIGNSTTTEQVNVTGRQVCLPHRDTSGPQTLECALGIQTTDGIYYALNTAGLPGNPLMNFSTGDLIRAGGTFVPNASSTTHWERYDIEGIIQVTSLTKI